MKDAAHLQSMGAYVKGEEDDGGVVKFEREGIAKHAQDLANRAKENLEGSLVGLDVVMVVNNTQRQKALKRMRTRSHTRGFGAGKRRYLGTGCVTATPTDTSRQHCRNRWGTCIVERCR